jgi:hypothetical protein
MRQQLPARRALAAGAATAVWLAERLTGCDTSVPAGAWLPLAQHVCDSVGSLLRPILKKAMILLLVITVSDIALDLSKWAARLIHMNMHVCIMHAPVKRVVT